MYGDCQNSISADRRVYVSTIESVREEWKQLEAHDLHQISKKQDAANRALVSLRYWEGKKEHEKAEPHRHAYDQNISEFVTLVQDLREKKEELEPNFILRSIQAEVLFLRSALHHAEQCEAGIRNLGPIVPIRFTGWKGVLNHGSHHSTFEDDSPEDYHTNQPSPRQQPAFPQETHPYQSQEYQPQYQQHYQAAPPPPPIRTLPKVCGDGCDGGGHAGGGHAGGGRDDGDGGGRDGRDWWWS
eukprot:TRINITY_DN442_c0_g1_i10.p1 TRINITY_DN442_c0_g1~~TRINITY_DN442_c0_g1_i10.p1  ORF type:complete len:272 (+),score=69.46 TRINITY_DN442_c0_g1_i10:93-818(+)